MYMYNHITGPVVFTESTSFGIADVATAIFMDSVRCLGSEHRLIDCDYESNHDCYHLEDVGIHCGQNSLNINIFLILYRVHYKQVIAF